ncbi:MAG: MYXO-CTERM sorting domain-containing protein [Sandaracinaceae bacterium]|nr:MYXO-CTERM sorting domain-containing protein [Sandaracinaceae bacterium]
MSGTSSPRYEPSPNVAEPIATATPRPTTLTIYRDATHPSAITLPVARGTPPGASEPPPDAGTDRDAGAGPMPSAGCGCRASPPFAGGAPLLALIGLVASRARRRRAERS